MSATSLSVGTFGWGSATTTSVGVHGWAGVEVAPASRSRGGRAVLAFSPDKPGREDEFVETCDNDILMVILGLDGYL